MSEDTVLTKEIAEQFIADEDSVDLSEFTAIEDEAAESLSKYDGYLDLSGLTELSDVAAESLSKRKGLNLDGLTSLSDAAAECLCNGKLQEICLEGVSSISDDAILLLHDSFEYVGGEFGRDVRAPTTIPDNAKDFRLAMIVGCDEATGCGYLSGPLAGDRAVGPLRGELTQAEAERLVSFGAVEVCLAIWYSVHSLEVLKTLSRGKFKAITLRLDEVTVELAEVLSEFHAQTLGLDALGISDDAATVLLQCKSELNVNLKPLTEDVRDILREVPSMSHWGRVTEPTITAACSLCGTIGSFTLEEDWKRADGECYELSYKCLERNEWLGEPVLCENCKEDDSDED